MLIRPIFLGGAPSLPPSQGPYEPGCTDVMTGDSKDNGLLVRLYYPTSLPKEKEFSTKWIPWLSHDNYIGGFASVLQLWTWVMYYLYKLLSADKKIPAVGDAPVNESIGKLPVIVFSHGMGGCRYLYATVCCELASNGYIVAAVEHRDGSAAATFYMEGNECKWLPFQHVRLRGAEHQKFRIEQVERRSEECVRALELLHFLNEGKVVKNEIETSFDLMQLKDRLSLSAPIMIGHSFGGATALLTLARNQDFKTGIILDPWLFPIKTYEDLPKRITQPLLCITSQAFPIPANQETLNKFMIGDQSSHREYYAIRHTTHEQQSDTIFLIGSWLNPLMKKLDFTLAIRLNNAVMIKFLREQASLKIDGDTELILDSKNKKYIIDGTLIDSKRNTKKIIPSQFVTLGPL